MAPPKKAEKGNNNSPHGGACRLQSNISSRLSCPLPHLACSRLGTRSPQSADACRGAFHVRLLTIACSCCSFCCSL